MSQVSTDYSQAGDLALSELKVCGFRSLYDVSLRLKRINIFVGPNGSGKSNLIMLFRLLHDIIEKESVSPKRYGPRPEELFWSGEEEEGEVERNLCEVTLYLGNPSGELPRLQYNIVIAVDGNRFFFPVERLVDETGRVFFSRIRNLIKIHKRTRDFTEDKPSLRILAKGQLPTGIFIEEEESTTIRKVFHFIQQWRVFDVDPRLIRKSLSKRLSGRPPASVPPLLPNGGNLREFLYALWYNHHEEFDLIQERLAAAELSERLWPVERLTRSGPVMLWGFEGQASPERFSSYTQSDGTLRFLAILALMLGDKTPSLICLDGPDHNLHPWLMMHLADAMRDFIEMRKPSSQILVTTHNPDLVDCLLDEEAGYLKLFAVRKSRTGKTQFVEVKADDLQYWDKYRQVGARKMLAIEGR